MTDERRPFPDSVCHRCARLRLVRSGKGAGAVYLQCTHPALPKYPPQPVRACAELEPCGA